MPIFPEREQKFAFCLNQSNYVMFLNTKQASSTKEESQTCAIHVLDFFSVPSDFLLCLEYLRTFRKACQIQTTPIYFMFSHVHFLKITSLLIHLLIFFVSESKFIQYSFYFILCYFMAEFIGTWIQFGCVALMGSTLHLLQSQSWNWYRLRNSLIMKGQVEGKPVYAARPC